MFDSGPGPELPMDSVGPDAPLSTRMRPVTFEEFVGHAGVVGEGTVLRRAIEADRIPSLILWGPPGSGKTTLARLIAERSKARFVALSAVSAGVADIRAKVADARELRKFSNRKTILFIDEIHRFNKSQQDAILPHVESGLIGLIGATTENPSFEVNGALLSRCRVFRLEALGPENIAAILDRALENDDAGLAAKHVVLDDDARAFLIRQSNGDARIALDALELAASAAPRNADGAIEIAVPDIEGALQHRSLLHDKDGDEHYNLISAFIKSIRGSDPDAAVYWLARMLEGGEDPMFVARRLVILAAEDVGLADPGALPLAIAAQQAAHLVGMPEGYLPLTEATLYLASAPKSNSAIVAYGAAKEAVMQTLNEPVPLYLRGATTGLQKAMGYGKGYRYAHDFVPEEPAGGEENVPTDVVVQEYLPDSLRGKQFYQPLAYGAEAKTREWLRRRRADSKE